MNLIFFILGAGMSASFFMGFIQHAGWIAGGIIVAIVAMLFAYASE